MTYVRLLGRSQLEQRISLVTMFNEPLAWQPLLASKDSIRNKDIAADRKML